jgi:CRP/FNR family transcriptional regulator, cyclic AMP receptor protein
LLSGRLRFSALSENGIEVPIYVVNPGESVGGSAILCGLPLLGSVAAVKDSTVGLISRSNARQLFDVPEVLRALSQAMAQQIQDGLQHHAEKGLPRADTRIAGVIMSSINNAEIDESPLTDLPTHATIGAMAKVSRETVSRVLKTLEHRGVIRKEGRFTRVRDRTALQRLAAGWAAAG